MFNVRSNLFISHTLVLHIVLLQLVFFFNGLELNLSHSAKHFGHILSSNLSDTHDIVRVKKESCSQT